MKYFRPFVALWLGSLAGSVAAAEPTHTIAFTSFGPINSAVFIADADGKNQRRLLKSSHQDANPSLSPDGRWVVFTSRRDGSPELYRVRVDGSRLERLTRDFAYDDQAAVSPDGGRVAFVSTRDGQADVWLLELQTRALRNLTAHPGGDYRPSWSPDGQWLAFTSDRDSAGARAATARSTRQPFSPHQSTQIYLMRADGSGQRRLTNGEASVGSAAWSPDGSRVVFHEAALVDWRSMSTDFNPLPPATSQIVSISVSSGDRTVHTSGVGRKLAPKWLSDGRIVYSRSPADDRHSVRLRVIPPIGGLAFAGGAGGPDGDYFGVSWSGDSKHFVFHRATPEQWPPRRRVFSQDSRFTLVRTGVFPMYSPDGRHLVMNTGFAAAFKNSVMLMDARSRERRVVLDDPDNSATAPVWSPDGKRIAFGIGQFFVTARGGGRADIGLMAADGSGFRRITDGQGNYGFPSWSPDGRQMVCRVEDGGAKLAIVEVDSGRVKLLTTGPANDTGPSWSPDGRRILFTSDRDGDWDLYTLSPDGSGIARLTNSPGNDAHGRWSSDGEWIVFASSRGGFKDEMPIGEGGGQAAGDLFVMRPDGTGVRRLTDDAWEDGTPTFAPLH